MITIVIPEWTSYLIFFAIILHAINTVLDIVFSCMKHKYLKEFGEEYKG